ncbi:MAG TPA: response regulator [Chloroflexota bacterium]|nr:response regulator [Chloroflexota bacterium]
MDEEGSAQRRAPLVLVVDDDPSNVKLIRLELELAGYRIAAASDGVEGIQTAVSLQPDLIFLDLSMPIMDGFQTVGALKSQDSTRAIPVVILTASTERADRLRALELGADDFLTKPFDPAELLGRAQTLTRLTALHRELEDTRARAARLQEREAGEARLGLILDTAPEAIILVAADGIIARFNRGAERIFGYAPDEVAGKPLGLLLATPLAVPPPGSDGRAGSEGGASLHRELLAHRRDGAAFPAELSVAYGEDGTYAVILRDVSLRRKAEAERQQLLERLLVAQEEERRRVAYEIHDGFAQVAAAAQQHLEAFASRYRGRSPAARQELDQAAALARRTVSEARGLIAGLRPTALDDFGLVAAVRLEVDALRNNGWSVELVDQTGGGRLPATVETSLFRVAQEALSNARRHANTRKVRVSLRRAESAVELDVRDWGDGFAVSAVREAAGPGERVGLAGMRERVAMLRGELSITSSRGRGTRVIASIPLPPEVT